ncbi:hypothetical protein AB5I41_22760 [Sphingomonas sp. MMS24-JH45]
MRGGSTCRGGLRGGRPGLVRSPARCAVGRHGPWLCRAAGRGGGHPCGGRGRAAGSDSEQATRAEAASRVAEAGHRATLGLARALHRQARRRVDERAAATAADRATWTRIRS